jgi:hypothetical protein
VEHLFRHNWTLTFQGDSMMGQTVRGLECELLRRGYNVSYEQHSYEVSREGYGYRYRGRSNFTFRVTSPSRGCAGATFVHRMMYRPYPDMEEVAEIAAESDIFVFDHGLHYSPHDAEDAELFANETRGILATALRSNRTKLVAWKETTPQHFNGTGGQ